MRVLAITLLVVAAGTHIPVKVKRGHGGATPPPAPLGSPSTLCSAMQPGDQVGGWWCLSGDGTMAVGSAVTLAPVNAPATLLWDVCGGTNCAQETMTRLNPTTASTAEGYQTASSVAPPTGSFTTCWLGRTENPTSTAAVPSENLLTFGSGHWQMILSGSAVATGLRTTAFPACNPCVASTGITTADRITSFQCSVFEASTRYRSCTYTQGVGTTCADTATVATQIDQTAAQWGIGLAANGEQRMTGFFRGAFMTEKALSSADITRLGALVLPSNPVAMGFSRASVKSCGSPMFTTRDVLLPANMACVNNDIAERELTAQTSFTPTESTGSGNLVGVGGSAAPTRTAAAGFSPYGMQSADRLDVQVSGAGAASYFERTGLPSPTAGDVVTYSFEVLGVAGSGNIYICGNVGDASPTDFSSAACGWNSTTWTTCSLTLTLTNTASSPALRAGNCDKNLVSAAQSVYVTDFNITKQGSKSSYIANPAGAATPVIRAAEVCAGSNCPP